MAVRTITAPVRIRSFRLRAISTDGLLAWPAIAALLFLLGGPIAFVVFTAFRGPGDLMPLDPRATFTLQNLTSVLQSGHLFKTLLDTLVFVVGTVFVATLFGLPLAWLFERTNVRFANTLYLLLLAPMLIPGIVSAQAWVLLLSDQQGLLNLILRWFFPFFETGPIKGFSITGMIIAQGLNFVPMFTLFIGAALRNMDGTLEEASRASGMGFLSTIRRVTLPLLMPAILSVCLLMTVHSLGQFEIPLVFGIGSGVEVFGIRIWKALNPQSGLPYYGEVASYSLLIMLFCFGLIYVYRKVTERSERFATITGKGHRTARMELGKWQPVVLGGIGLYLLVTAVFPLFILLWQSVVPYYTAPSWEFLTTKGGMAAYAAVLGDERFWQSVRNTAVIAIASSTITTLLAAVVAWVVVRSRPGLVTTVLDMFVSSSMAVSGAVAAVALLMFYLTISGVVPIYGTIFALVFGYAYRVGTSYRMDNAAIRQIGKELEEASRTSGASSWFAFRNVLLPLLAPTLFVTWFMGLNSGLHEFTIPLFLSNQSTTPVSVYIYQLMAQRPSQAAAAGVMTVAFTLVAVGVGRLVTNRMRGG